MQSIQSIIFTFVCYIFCVYCCVLKSFPSDTQFVFEIDNNRWYQKIPNGCISGAQSWTQPKYIEGFRVKIPTMHSFAISDVQTLEEIKFIENDMHTVEANAFFNLPKLKIIQIIYNKLTLISKGAFKNLPLEQLIFRYNQLQFIQEGAFEGLFNLKEVDFSYNQLNNWNPKWFDNSSNLEILNFDFNFITKVEKSFDIFPNLKNLSLAHNGMEYIDSKTFEGISLLESIDISGNSFKILPSDTFKSLKKLSFLSLNGNYLMYLPEIMLYDLHSLDVLHIHDNPWHCPCYNKIRRIANRYKWKVNINYRHCYDMSVVTPVCVGSNPPKRHCEETYDEEALKSYLQSADSRIWRRCQPVVPIKITLTEDNDPWNIFKDWNLQAAQNFRDRLINNPPVSNNYYKQLLDNHKKLPTINVTE